MNHRDEHLHVLSMSLIKDRPVTLNDALKACLLYTSPSPRDCS